MLLSEDLCSYTATQALPDLLPHVSSAHKSPLLHRQTSQLCSKLPQLYNLLHMRRFIPLIITVASGNDLLMNVHVFQCLCLFKNFRITHSFFLIQVYLQIKLDRGRKMAALSVKKQTLLLWNVLMSQPAVTFCFTGSDRALTEHHSIYCIEAQSHIAATRALLLTLDSRQKQLIHLLNLLSVA